MQNDKLAQEIWMMLFAQVEPDSHTCALIDKKLIPLRKENTLMREALEYIYRRGYTGASYVALKALHGESWE